MEIRLSIQEQSKLHILNLTDKDGNKVEYTGTIKVTYTFPGDWNLNYGIKALTVSGSSLGDYKFLR